LHRSNSTGSNIIRDCHLRWPVMTHRSHWGPDDFSVGQRIMAHGRPAVIEKVNPKTLRVKNDLEWMNALDITKVPYDALSQKCKEVA